MSSYRSEILQFPNRVMYAELEAYRINIWANVFPIICCYDLCIHIPQSAHHETDSNSRIELDLFPIIDFGNWNRFPSLHVGQNGCSAPLDFWGTLIQQPGYTRWWQTFTRWMMVWSHGWIVWLSNMVVKNWQISTLVSWKKVVPTWHYRIHVEWIGNRADPRREAQRVWN